MTPTQVNGSKTSETPKAPPLSKKLQNLALAAVMTGLAVGIIVFLATYGQLSKIGCFLPLYAGLASGFAAGLLTLATGLMVLDCRGHLDAPKKDTSSKIKQQ